MPEDPEEDWHYNYFVLGDFLAATTMHPHLGSWNGYLGLPAAHPWAGLDYDDIEASVHGGLTFADRTLGMEDEMHPMIAWWIGFDTGHFNDFSPKMHALKLASGITTRTDEEEMARFGSSYKDENYVRAELERLAQQAAQAWQESGAVSPDESAARAETTLEEREQRREDFRRQAQEWAASKDRSQKAFEDHLAKWYGDTEHTSDDMK